eukprot:5153844-Lingulodinium_polyedra.AAC.1
MENKLTCVATAQLMALPVHATRMLSPHQVPAHGQQATCVSQASGTLAGQGGRAPMCQTERRPTGCARCRPRPAPR